ncbi:MAG: YraN family protein [Pseudomonadota bacterium]
MATARTLGARSEQLARRYLQRHGLQIVATNFNSRFGEIDIIATDSECLVFVEVRYRSRNPISRAAHTVDARKQRRLTLAAHSYLARHPRFAASTCRFDIVGIDDDNISWLKDAFRPA